MKKSQYIQLDSAITANEKRCSWIQHIETPLSTSTVILLFASLLSCGSPPPLHDSLNTRINYHVDNPDTFPELIRAIREEDRRVDIAFYTIQNLELVEALLEAKKRGAEVRAVFDKESENDTQVQRLLKGGIEVTFVDGEIKYLPDPSLVRILPEGYVVRPGSLSDMSHHFVLLGKTSVWNFSTPIPTSSTARGMIGYHAVSELLMEDFTREFKQLHANVSATSLDVYGGPTKSVVHTHPYERDDGEIFYYSDSLFTDQGRLRLLFSPQNAPVKTLIDEIYRAKGSIFIQSESIEDPGVILALKQKLNFGFNVKVLVNRQKQLARTIPLLQELNVIKGGTAKGIDIPYLPTVIIFDEEKGVGDNHLYPRQAMVMSHEVLSAKPLEVIPGVPDDSLAQYKSDFYSDGLSWIVSETVRERGEHKVITKLVNDFETQYNAKTATPL